MLETLPVAPPDSILGLADAFNADTRTDKVNLTVGVYKDEQGQTPILGSVKKAESRILQEERSKGYLGIDGLPDFNRLVTELVFGSNFDSKRVAVVQSPGGTGGLRLAAEMVGTHYPGTRIWISQPTWPNHPSIFTASGLEVKTYPYLDAAKTGLDIDAMLRVLQQETKAGDMVCLHACCHNPTGIDPTPAQWRQIADSAAERGWIPFLDFAYQGFGDGIEEDALAVRCLLEKTPEAIVVSSFSKNFGLYSERVGAAFVVARDELNANAALSQLKQTVRANYSNPPRHGGSIVAIIMNDPTLRQQWEMEVAEMRARIHQMRLRFVEGMKQTGVDRDFSFLLNQKGMFSYTGLNAMQADWLKKEKGIYIVGTGRINVAGLTSKNLTPVCQAIAECIESTKPSMQP